MSLAIGDTAPDFHAETSEGPIDFHQWIGDSWAVLFSHPKDFTPVCTTELGYMAKIKPDFDARGVKIIGLSIDSTSDHARWAADIAETQGTAPNYPIIADDDFHIAKAYDMLPAATTGDAKSRTPADSSAPCKRVAAAPVVFTFSKSEPQTGQENPALVCPALQTGSVAWTVVAAAIDGDQQIHLAAPPPDLITLLQHFNI